MVVNRDSLLRLSARVGGGTLTRLLELKMISEIFLYWQLQNSGSVRFSTGFDTRWCQRSGRFTSGHQPGNHRDYYGHDLKQLTPYKLFGGMRLLYLDWDERWQDIWSLWRRLWSYHCQKIHTRPWFGLHWWSLWQLTGCFDSQLQVVWWVTRASEISWKNG